MDYNNNGGKNRNGENRREYGKRPRIMARRNTAGHYESSDRREKVYSEKVNIYEDGNSYNTYGEHNSYGERRTSFGHRNDNRRQGYGERRPQAYGERRSSETGDRRPQQRNAGFVRKGQPNAAKQANRKRQQAPKPAQTESGINRMIRRKQQMDSFTYSDNDLISIPVKEEIRLNRFISNSGICSRREADNYIQAGVVTVNGKVVTELGTKVNINTDDVRFNGERLKGEEKVYIVMNKPKGFVTTASDPHAEKTVMDLIKGCKARVFPVGRLDKNTTGVLMFTNDGEMAEKLTHPSYNKKKIYQVTLGSKLKAEDYDRILAGVALSDGEIAADELEYVDENDHRKIGIEIHSGKNRIVRRIFESLGYEVKALDRVYFAGLTKKNLKRGHWRFLTEGEINILKMGAYN